MAKRGRKKSRVAMHERHKGHKGKVHGGMDAFSHGRLEHRSKKRKGKRKASRARRRVSRR